MLKNIENIDAVLSEYELQKLRKMYSTIENFNEITESLTKNIVSNKINESDLISIFNLIKKTAKTGEKIQPVTDYSTKRGLVRSFFELPEILSNKLASQK